MRPVLVLIALFGLLSCSSYIKRKNCEKINWYEHGYKVAMSGKRLNADSELKACEKVEAKINWSEVDLGFKSGMANYCKDEVVFATGKSGEFLNLELCNSSKHAQLKAKHAEGVRAFCDSTNGYPFGATGKAYNKICPTDLEKAFLVEYRQGRRVYLNRQVLNKQGEIARLDGEINRLRGELGTNTALLNYHRAREPDQKVSVYNRVTSQFEEAPNEAHEKWEQQEEDLSSKVSSAEYEISSLERKKQNIHREIDAMRTEIDALGR